MDLDWDIFNIHISLIFSQSFQYLFLFLSSYPVPYSIFISPYILSILPIFITLFILLTRPIFLLISSQSFQYLFLFLSSYPVPYSIFISPYILSILISLFIFLTSPIFNIHISLYPLNPSNINFFFIFLSHIQYSYLLISSQSF